MRLTSATSPMFGTATYAYDVLDNLSHVTVSGGSQARDQAYFYDAANRLTNVMAGGASVIGLGYDVQGNLANKNGVLYGFDYGNRMRSGSPETYRYDVQGRRIRSSSSAGLVYSLYAQSGQLLFQRDERAGKRRQYVYLGGSLVAETSVPLAGGAATVTYQHTDALGSPVATTNASKAVLQRSEYEPYGYLLNRPMEDGPGYTGHVTDAATGLVYMQQRYYDSGLGEFPTTDPVTAYSAGGTFNRYWYANANPYRFTDPDGRDPGDNNSSQTDPYVRQQQIEEEARRRAQERREQEKRARQAAKRGRISIPRFCESRADCAVIAAQEQYVNGEISKSQLDEVYAAQGYGAAAGLALVGTWFTARYVARNTSVDGPNAGVWHANGRVIGLRWKESQWGIRLDLHPLKGDPSHTPVLHLNIGPLGRGEAGHITIFDPRWFGD